MKNMTYMDACNQLREMMKKKPIKADEYRALNMGINALIAFEEISQIGFSGRAQQISIDGRLYEVRELPR